MVGIIEGVLIAGALGLDVYAYSKMKEAENAARESQRLRERETFKSKVGQTTTTVNVAAQPVSDAADAEPHVPAGTTLHQETPIASSEESEQAAATWKPVTYEGFAAPAVQNDDMVDELRAMRVDNKTEYQKLHDRLDTIDERISEQDSKLTVMETKFSHMDGEVEKLRRDVQENQTGISDEQVEVLVSQKLSGASERLNKKVKNLEKELFETRAKLDSHVIAAPETVLIKKDLREEFAPALAEPVKKLQEHQKESDERHKELTKRITQAKEAALEEAKTRVSKGEFARSISALKAEKPKSRAATKVSAKTEKKAAKTKKTATKKSTTTTAATKVTVKKTAKVSAKKAQKPARKTVAKKDGKADKGSVTVTTSVPKGVDVSTEVVSG